MSSCIECFRYTKETLWIHRVCPDCQDCIQKYYRKCSGCNSGLILPAVSDDITLCVFCLKPGAGMDEVIPGKEFFPCTTEDCTGTVDEKWKKKCLNCYLKSVGKGNATERSGNATEVSFSGQCITPACSGKTDAKWKKRCGKCYGKGLR